MATNYRQNRNVELSTIYFIETSLASAWNNITVVKSFTQASKATLPVVAVRLLEDSIDYLEIGSSTITHIYSISIDIFATSDGQRLDIADYLVSILKGYWAYYIHSQDSNISTSLDRIADGYIHCIGFTSNNRLDFGENVAVEDKFRHNIIIEVRTSNL